MSILKPNELQAALKPSTYSGIDCTEGNAIVLLPSSTNQVRPTIQVKQGATVAIYDFTGNFKNGVEVRAPKGFTVDGGESIFCYENYTTIVFRLIGTNWRSYTEFNHTYDPLHFSSAGDTLELINVKYLKYYKFELILETKYGIETVTMQYRNGALDEINYSGTEIVEFSSYILDDNLMLKIEPSDDLDVLASIIPIALLRK
tara:strand:+ start:122 stop:727 length:606 start_codon:yes stop_codon:yes gene_type:complete